MADPREQPPARERSIPIDPLWEPITRGDVLFILDLIYEYSSRSIAGSHAAGIPAESHHFVNANISGVIRSELRERWNIPNG